MTPGSWPKEDFNKGVLAVLQPIQIPVRIQMCFVDLSQHCPSWAGIEEVLVGQEGLASK